MIFRPFAKLHACKNEVATNAKTQKKTLPVANGIRAAIERVDACRVERAPADNGSISVVYSD
eukprot:310477-Pyramimonas_sp.AAC.1